MKYDAVIKNWNFSCHKNILVCSGKIYDDTQSVYKNGEHFVTDNVFDIAKKDGFIELECVNNKVYKLPFTPMYKE